MTTLEELRLEVARSRQRVLDHYHWSRDPDRAPCPWPVILMIRHRWWQLYRQARAELWAAEHQYREAA